METWKIFYELINNIVKIKMNDIDASSLGKKEKIYLDSYSMIIYLNNLDLNESDKTILKEIIKRYIELGINNIPDKSYKRKSIYCITLLLKEELNKIKVKEKTKEINNLNEWIESLNIYKPFGKYLSDITFKNSDELYRYLRQIVIHRSALYKKVHAKGIVNKLLNPPDNINIKNEDYELSLLIKLINNNEEFNRSLNNNLGYALLENNKTHEWVNNIKKLIK